MPFTEIHQRSTVTLPCTAPCGLLVIIIVMSPADDYRAVAYFAENTICHILVKQRDDRKVAVDMSHGDLESEILSVLIQFARRLIAHCHGLFEKKVASGIQAVPGNLEM